MEKLNAYNNITLIKMMSQLTPKHMLDKHFLLKLEKIFNTIEINPNSTYPLSEPSVGLRVLTYSSRDVYASNLCEYFVHGQHKIRGIRDASSSGFCRSSLI